MDDGALVFRRPRADGNDASDRRRRRADTEDTADSAEEDVHLELAPEVEMADRNAAAGGDADGRNDGDVSTGTDDGDFATSDDADAADFAGTDAMNDGSASSSAPAPSGERLQVPEAAPRPRQRQRPDVPSDDASRNLEIRTYHDILLFVCAACLLSLLFRFNFGRVICVLYGLGGSLALHWIVFRPAYDRVLSAKFGTDAFGNFPGCRGKYFTWIDVISAVTGFAMGIAWIVVGLNLAQPMNSKCISVFIAIP